LPNRRAKRPITVCASPKGKRDRHGIDIDPLPPCRLITVPVKLAMVEATNRNRELVADLAAQSTRLRKAKMMWIRRFAAAHHARLLGYKFAVVLVAQADSLANKAGWAGAGFFGDSRRGFFTVGVRMVRLRLKRILEGLRQHVTEPAIAKCRELCLEACFDKDGVGARQRVLGGQAPMGPARRVVGGLKGVEFSDQPIPQCCGLIGGQNGLR
jgi:hypothetical protein